MKASRGEIKICDILTAAGVSFAEEYSFPDLLGHTKHPLRFDFAVFDDEGEVDFLIEYKGNVLPLEVKSGKDYKVHSALNNLLSNAEYDIPEAVVLCNGNVNKAGKVLYLPIYMVMLLKRTAPESTTIKLDLSTLVI